jgi:hypothetical protein
MLYGFQDESSAALQHTVFLHYTLINRSAHTYDSLRAGFWHDTELGQGGDDLAGCDTALYLGYVYNAGETDNVYGASPPAQGTVWLGEDDWRYITHQNNFSLTGVPQFATEYYTYLDARWKDGSPVTRGGSGYGGITPVQYIYSGDPVADTGWTARQAFPSGTDVLSVLAGGPYTLAPGDRICLDMALAFARDSAGGADRLGNISLLRQYAATLRAFYQAQGYACDDQATGISSPGPALQQKIFPNPAREILCITTALPLVSVTIWNSLGQPIPVTAHQEPGRICLDLNGLAPGNYWIRYTGQDTEGSAGFVVWP